MFPRSLALLLVAALLSGPAGAADRKTKFNWDALGAEFCRLTLANDLAGMRDLLSDSLAQQIAFAAARNPGLPPARVLFQSYTNEVPVCEARTRNAAIIAITRSNPGGAAPAWTEYVEVVPAPDGTTRVDNVLFATKRSDTLRSRLEFYAGR